jgi:molybdopterin molybdotransferase
MIRLNEAIEIIKKIDFRMPLEEVVLTNSYHRILGEDVFSDINMPPFDKSAMDGYACRSEDLTQPMQVIGTLHAGSNETFTVEPGTCVKIMTGAPVPLGANTVIKIEDTGEDGNNAIKFQASSTKKNICKLGEDIKAGELVLKSGTRLLPQHIALLASVGISKVKVSSQPKIAIFSTGSELVEPNQKPGASQIRNSNAYSLLSQLQTMNLDVDYKGIVPDDKKKIKEMVIELRKSYDVLIITGGASLGEHDFVPLVFKELNFELKFNKLAIQPGKPFSFAADKNTFCFGLSGNPVSAFLQFEVLVKPFVFHLMHHNYSPKIITAELAEKIQRKKADRLKFFPVTLNANGQAEEIKFNGSAHIAGLTNAAGFGLFPENCTLINTSKKIEILLMQ